MVVEPPASIELSAAVGPEVIVGAWLEEAPDTVTVPFTPVAATELASASVQFTLETVIAVSPFAALLFTVKVIVAITPSAMAVVFKPKTTAFTVPSLGSLEESILLAALAALPIAML